MCDHLCEYDTCIYLKSNIVIISAMPSSTFNCEKIGFETFHAWTSFILLFSIFSNDRSKNKIKKKKKKTLLFQKQPNSFFNQPSPISQFHNNINEKYFFNRGIALTFSPPCFAKLYITVV